MIAVLGGQWGDEGKGKLVDLLAVDADLVCRAQVSEHGGSLPSLFHHDLLSLHWAGRQQCRPHRGGQFCDVLLSLASKVGCC